MRSASRRIDRKEPCWTEIVRRYTHRPVHLRSPEDRRGPVLDQLPEAPLPTLGTTPPASGMLEVPSFIPLHDWKAKWLMRVIPDAARRERDDAGAEHPGRCAGLLVARVLLDGEPADGARVWLRSGGREIFQGRPRRAELRPAHGRMPARCPSAAPASATSSAPCWRTPATGSPQSAPPR